MSGLFIDLEGVCVKSCEIGEFMNIQTLRCEVCPLGCEECEGKDECTGCVLGY